MKYRVWYSTEAFADYIINHTNLRCKNVITKRMYESDANNATNFHTMPDHIKKILYLDAPDLIVEINHEPIFSVEVSTEAGTGHNAFQRFARLAASVENNVPAFYIYPEAVIIERENSTQWDRINPLIFKALDRVMSTYQIPALLYYYPSDFTECPTQPELAGNRHNGGLRHEADIDYAGSPSSNDAGMIQMFEAMNDVIAVFEQYGIVEGRKRLNGKNSIKERREWMNSEYISKGGNMNMSPLSATVKIPTKYLLNYLEAEGHHIGELLRNREETVLYKANAKFRGDPYPGSLAAIDYLYCREGKTFEERKYNLVLVWSDVEVDEEAQIIRLPGTKGTIKDFITAVQNSESKNILNKNYTELKRRREIPRYYMQVRYGSTYSKVKHIRVFSYFADAILFPDGAVWRDA
ncbi:MAG: hypothetical protein Q4G28_07010 [Neisseria sp.]|nr:hypothetical protein [Neisseria sp.]